MADFQRLFARYRVILAIATVAGAVVALGLALAKSTTYSATATLSIADITQIEGSLGQTATSTQLPAQIAAVAQRSVKSDAVLGRALQSVPWQRTITTLRDHVSSSIDAASDLVLITGQDSTARRSAAVANGVAVQTAATTNAQTRATFAADAAGLARQIAALPHTSAYATIRRDDEANYSRLQTLAVIAAPAKIQQRADLPTSPDPKRTAFYVVLGAILGMILGVGVAFVRESLDRTVHAPEDVADNLGLPIVGHVDERALAAAPFLSRNGSDRAALARYGILRRGVELMGDHPPRTVLVTSPGPEEGKTTVALSLACAFAAAGRRTALVEADLHRPVLAQRLRLPPGDGIAGYLRGAQAELPIQSVALDANGSLDVVLAGGAANGTGDVLALRRFADVLSKLAVDHEVVVLDGPPLIPVADALELVPLVETYLVCLRAGRTPLAQLSATRQLLERLPARPGGAVITGVAAGRYQLSGVDGYYRDAAA